MHELKKNKFIKFYIAAVIILLVFLHYLGVLAIPENFAMNILSDAQNTTYAFLTKLKYSIVNYQEAQNLKKENVEQKAEINQLTYEISQLKALEQENEKLSRITDYKKDKDFDLITGKVISRDLNRVNTLIINKGEFDGLKPGLPVIVDNGIIIGKLIDVRKNTSTVLLLTDQFSQLAVSLINSNKAIGLAKGEFGLSIKVEFIPQDLDIEENDLIITSGMEQNIPRGLIIGKVNRIISYKNELFKSATISPLADYGEITILSIVIPKTIIQ
ncbi:rod shape-determining protein MreC [Candidatus Falkowbacteria bacterium]|nr:rod shape-determining protein MreC [Candidatus Falkowbacteria bacterium]